MYRREIRPEEQLFYQLFLQELATCCQKGAELLLEGQRASPEAVAGRCIGECPGEYMAAIDRDQWGNITCLRFFQAVWEDF